MSMSMSSSASYVFQDQCHRSNTRDRLCPFSLSALPPFLFVFLILATLFGLFSLYYPGPLSLTLFPFPKPGYNLQADDQWYNCDLYVGRWVQDLQGPSYTNLSCRTIPDSKNCFLQGRPDKDFLNWRWKPDSCQLPRFDPKLFLETVRGKTIAFIGDSLARNQMESLLCLLSQEETPIVIYNDAEDRFGIWRFADHNFTLKNLWSQFLVSGEEMEINGTLSGSYQLHIDKVDEKWASELPGIDYAIISTGNWFFRKIYVYDGSNIIGCVNCNEPGVTSLDPEHAIRLALRYSLNHIRTCKSCKSGSVTLLRTFSPGHFESGTWDTGGTCNRTAPYTEEEAHLNSNEWRFRNMQVEELELVTSAEDQARQRFGVLDVTRAMLMRPDGHPGEFLGNRWGRGHNDCLHWCLPGPIDLWNEFLMSHLRKLRPKHK